MNRKATLKMMAIVGKRLGKRVVRCLLAVVAIGFAASPARADGVTSNFTITSFFVSQQNNFQYRVYGMPAVASCSNATTWAYVNDSEPSSKGIVTAILFAYAAGKLINLNLQTLNGYCHIVEVQVAG
jgi:hypothetical protein